MVTRSRWRVGYIGCTVPSMRATGLTRWLSIAALVGAAACGSRSTAGSAADSGSPRDPEAGRRDGARSDTEPAELALRDRVIRACVMAASCGPGAAQGDGLEANRCVDWFGRRAFPSGGLKMGPGGELERLLGCAAAKGCSEFERCYGGNWVGAGPCREPAHCDGDVIVAFEAKGRRLDCAAIGANCVDLATGAPRACCATRSCPGAQETTCNGRQGVLCLLGIGMAFQCPPGMTCNPGFDVAPCRGEGQSCQPDEDATCEGTVSVSCVGGHRARIDCSTNELLSGYSLAPGSVPCGPAGSACKPSDPPHCEGSSVVVCVDGQTATVDCRALGFELCFPGTGGCGYFL